MDDSKVQQLKQFVDLCKSNPSILYDPSLSFFRDYIEGLGAKLPTSSDKSKYTVDDESDEDVADAKPHVEEVEEEEEEEEIVESDVELEGEIVEPDNDAPQKMGDSSVEVTDENREAAQEEKMKAMEAISEGKPEEAIEHLTSAILLNPSAIMYATRASVYVKMKKPNAAIRDADAALEINPDSAKGHKARGMARAMLGQWAEAAKDLHGTLEVVEIDPDSYDASNLGNDTVLVNYGRLSCGQEQWGPGLSNDTDFVWRSWQSDAKFRSKNMKGPKVISTTTAVNGANQKPNYFPTKLYQHAVTVGNSGVLEYELTVDAKLDYLLWFHFAEIDSKVTKAGQRVFDVQVNGENVNRIDVYKAVGGFKAHDWHYVAKNLSSTSLTVKLAPVVGEPILSGLEAYAIVPNDLATVPDQVVAMRALKDSLRIPGRMGWNGDPCAPATWNAWEGVICRTNKEGNALVISQIDLGSQGLKGFISDRISLLTNLAVLNLSSNSLTGSLPEGLGQQSLVKLDLSNNELTGSIPDSLATSRNLRLVLLNDNKLEGRVPEEIYSVGVHGGAIDLSANKGLCGMPSLPECPLFWSNGQLSRGGKIGIGLSCMVVVMVLLLVAYICIRRKRNDYDFGLPHELMSMAAKRNRYHRQKSLMVLEMESQHAKGLIPPSKPQ